MPKGAQEYGDICKIFIDWRENKTSKNEKEKKQGIMLNQNKLNIDFSFFSWLICMDETFIDSGFWKYLYLFLLQEKKRKKKKQGKLYWSAIGTY